MASNVSGIGKVAESVELGTRKVRGLLSLFLKPSITQLGLFGGDWLKSQRETQLAKTLAKAKAKLNAGKLAINPVPLKLLKPIVEDCSLEEDEDMIERWANLLAAAACGDPVLPTYVRLLAELTPNEAQLLLLSAIASAGTCKSAAWPVWWHPTWKSAGQDRPQSG